MAEQKRNSDARYSIPDTFILRRPARRTLWAGGPTENGRNFHPSETCPPNTMGRRAYGEWTKRASRIGNRETRTGFTLVETVVASVILCGTVLVVGAISTRAVSGGRLNRQYETAALVADRQLRLIDYVGIDSFIESGQMEGVFEPAYGGLAYYWTVATEDMDIDSLCLVTITVSWMDGNHPYSITVDTMLDGVGVTNLVTPTGSTGRTDSTGSTGTE